MAYDVVVCLGGGGRGKGDVEFFDSSFDVDLTSEERFGSGSCECVAKEGCCLHHGLWSCVTSCFLYV